MTRRLAPSILLAALFAGVPAQADNTKTPPGDPCAKGNGNPCGGNNGNVGSQGNSGGKTTYSTPGPIIIALPAVAGRGVYVTQIGEANAATVKQTAPRAYASVRQTGGQNTVNAAQAGTGTAYTDIRQTGDANAVVLGQGGSGANAGYVTQTGDRNRMTLAQNATGALYNAAALTQTGNGNRMSLTQNGSDNRAIMTQTGNDDSMTASQTGAGNRLDWTQNGSGFPDLGITQTGNQAVKITQTGGR